MSYHVVQPSQPTHEITRSRSHHTRTDTTPQSFTPLPPHLRNERFYFDNVEEADEFRAAAAAALKLRNHPELCALPARHVTQDDLQGFASFIKNEIAQIKCGVNMQSQEVLCVCRPTALHLVALVWTVEAKPRMMEGNKCCTMLHDLSQNTTL